MRWLIYHKYDKKIYNFHRSTHRCRSPHQQHVMLWSMIWPKYYHFYLFHLIFSCVFFLICGFFFIGWAWLPWLCTIYKAATSDYCNSRRGSERWILSAAVAFNVSRTLLICRVFISRILFPVIFRNRLSPSKIYVAGDDNISSVRQDTTPSPHANQIESPIKEKVWKSPQPPPTSQRSTPNLEKG